MTDTDFQGRSVVVTAAGRNIGKAIALAFAAQGANVVINARSNSQALDNTAAEIEALGARALPVLADAVDPEGASSLVAKAVETFGRVDITVSCVGIRPFAAFEDITVEQWRQVIDTDLSAAFYLARAAVPHMRAAGWGRIIHITGTNAHTPHPNRAHVIAAKHGLHGLTRAMALELGPHGITVNSVSPGFIETARNPADFPELDEMTRSYRENLPVRRLGEVSDVTAACLYLASQSGRFITGQSIAMNGGEAMI